MLLSRYFKSSIQSSIPLINKNQRKFSSTKIYFLVSQTLASKHTKNFQALKQCNHSSSLQIQLSSPESVRLMCKQLFHIEQF
jgi:hypothetical protein